MPRSRSNGVELEYESHGDPAAPTILLINGLGSQMTRWPVPFCEKLTARGFRVLRFDNRDVGLSTWLPEGSAYDLTDMAADAVAVLDAAGVAKAHIAGVSMGGMIAQLVAADHPDRVLSLTSIMSTTGDPALPQMTAEALKVLTVPAPDPKADLEAYVAHGMRNARTIGSPAYPWEDAMLRERVIAEMTRAYNPPGVARQSAAIRANGDRTAKVRGIKVPTVILHGREDPLVPVTGGEATARAIPGAELRIIPGMGHDLPPSLYDTFVEAITAAAARAG